MTCPHPEKVAFGSERAAKSAVRDLKTKKRDGVGFLHAYRCGGHWHIGHGRKNRNKKPGRKFR